jgi:hypothetical protein
MNYSAQSYPTWRCPRVQLADITPAVLRLPDGSGSRGILNIVSLTGGLLSVSNTLDRGSRINLMFVTAAGPVVGAAEMLPAISTNQQPFRFVALEEGAQRRLRIVIQSHLEPVEQAWITKYRAAMDYQIPARRPTVAIVLAAIALMALCLGSAVYLLPMHVLK